MSELLDAKAFLSPARFKMEEVELPSGGKVRVRALDVGARDRFVEIGAETAGRLKLSRLLVVTCCVDKDGNRIFADDAMDSIAAAPAEDVEAIAQAAMRLSGMKTKADDAETDAPND